ncbi:MAG TPA: DUF992 domain-containing protein [Acetobacteraceae bacterium]|jgi:Protein of unknown function (DUF992)|nr:DUF992 domain-containing protein [Acetobacteraceae bacterium]
MQRISTVSAVTALLLAGGPALAQQQPAAQAPTGQAAQRESGTVRVGTLRCDVSGSRGFIFGSTRDLDCRFTNVQGRRESYRGQISRYGVDLGFTNHGVLLWGVLAPTTDVRPGVLAGTFEGVSANVTALAGVGANVLVGGSQRSVALQPLSIEGNTGLSLALGVARLRLTKA